MSAQGLLPRIALGLVLVSVSIFAFLYRDQINLAATAIVNTATISGSVLSRSFRA